jgi:hypothetical protein
MFTNCIILGTEILGKLMFSQIIGKFPALKATSEVSSHKLSVNESNLAVSVTARRKNAVIICYSMMHMYST